MANEKVAVPGTGLIGGPMARNLLAAGFPLVAWNRTRAKAEVLADSGAEVADTPEAAVADRFATFCDEMDGADKDHSGLYLELLRRNGMET